MQVFTSAVFKPATDTVIIAFEAGMAYRFCDDFRAWLAGDNGIEFRWPYINLWNFVSDAAEVAFEAEIKSLSDRRWELAVRSIIGLQPSRLIWNEYADPPGIIESARGLVDEFATWRSHPYLRLMYPVAGIIGGKSQGWELYT